MVLRMQIMLRKSCHRTLNNSEITAGGPCIPHPLGWGGRPQFDFFIHWASSCMVFQNLKENFIDIFLRIDDFLSTSTRLSNPVLWCFHTIIDFISSCHDSLRIASKHVTYILLSTMS